MTKNNEAEPQETGQGPHDQAQEHPAQEAHGGSMAPELVDDTGHEKGGDEEE
ncbi:hypothetical protein Ani05nite_44970 [Amorphoplanes nipponensis]|uniref:Uncharacterized protein n=1 Tax=Actinoplanes nipponensis TaxID=135950 RepID=A0A919JJS0_9ACTN|nr:hypothetical protein [Actinoplanes nipponensis]GIE50963.1 hypothetical protein Ani05nite_44970 [Actinoplanes nipponensis]